MQDSEETDIVYGPVRPISSSDTVFAGPDLPPHLMSGCSDDTESEQTDLIGPKLPESESQSSSIAQQFEARSLRMKEKLNNKGLEKAVRDSWMTEIPDRIGSELGLPVAKTKFGDGKQKIDRSGWESTPQRDVKQTCEDGGEMLQTLRAEKDHAIASSVDNFSKRTRPDSLLETHQKKLKKEKKKKSKKEKKEKRDKCKKKHKDKKKCGANGLSERKPFDRDQDLHVNAFDDAKKKALIRQSQQLTSRFSSSTVQGQFL